MAGGLRVGNVGGRRQNYVAAGTHHGPVGSTVPPYINSTTSSRPTTPPVYSALSPASIWSGPSNGSTSAVVNPVPLGGTSMLGAALETAVAEAATMAVARAMAEHEIEKSSSVSDRSDGSDCLSKEQVEEMKKVMRENGKVMEEMKRRVDNLEKSLGNELNKRIEAERELAQEVRNRKALAAEVRKFHEAVKELKRSSGDARGAKTVVNRVEKELWELRKEAQSANRAVRRDLDKNEMTVEQLSKDFDRLNEKSDVLEKNIAGCTGEANSREITKGLKSRLKRLEIALEKKGKESREGALLDQNMVESLTSRVERAETNVAKLKKLIASNLRTDQKVEEVVKTNVSVITKHVCSAMRYFTSKKITDNNRLLDKVLRQRISEYANHDDDDEEYVLVQQIEEEIPIKSKIMPTDAFNKAMAAFEHKDSKGHTCCACSLIREDNSNRDSSAGTDDDNASCSGNHRTATF
eukprot:Plantae.Rhodophyta-Hildenbrandia_rubra.ctg18051.p1 GENE.Plantae.Rhodophyta-Hildenbrandia_rubra.ctg18051~~Plantae.Rhodophyta-Hildenbrandia_rubra.ctg18051.p1  ORF type:complete len:466 (+),score=112.69 Plantae.Rhodophyta-Hildenbrandia_rubra.ctg18051:1997-3394(+)